MVNDLFGPNLLSFDFCKEFLPRTSKLLALRSMLLANEGDSFKAGLDLVECLDLLFFLVMKVMLFVDAAGQGGQKLRLLTSYLTHGRQLPVEQFLNYAPTSFL